MITLTTTQTGSIMSARQIFILYENSYYKHKNSINTLNLFGSL